MASNDSDKFKVATDEEGKKEEKISIGTASDVVALEDYSMSVYGVSKEYCHDSLGSNFEQFGDVKDIFYEDVFNSGQGL